MNNPSIIIALEKELVRFKSSAEARAAGKNVASFMNKLCALWNSYEKRIKDDVFEDKLLELGDFLFNLKYYLVASDHCFGRYLLTKFTNFYDIIKEKEEKIVLETFFPNINDIQDVEKTAHALLGFSSSTSLAIIDDDPQFLNSETPAIIVDMLRLIQIAMQTALKRDSHCWLVYNGTILLHEICCVLMRHGFPRDILKYLLWACVSMESSVPLMTVKYFGWRSQLYLSTCQCYLDLKADSEAEKFALRGLEKVEELKEIEQISSLEPTPESVFIFNQATLKLMLITFKRQVFENKRRTKGTMRSKIKPVLKDIIHLQWPRTGTERLLAELFRSRASQFLAVIEGLKNSHRRLIQTSAGTHESDDCLDSYSELFFAGVELLAGGGGPKPLIPGKHEKLISEVVSGISMMNLAASDSQSISIASAVQFIKLLYNYEQWEYFDLLVLPSIEELKKFPDDKDCQVELKILNLLYVMSPVNPTRIKKKMLSMKAEELESATAVSKHKLEYVENLNIVATVLNNFVIKDIDSELLIICYHDALVDATIFLWTKCRKFFSRINSSTYETSKYQDKCLLYWLKLLVILQKLMLKLKLNDIDICASAEASLKLAVILECVALYNTSEIDSDQTGDRTSGCMSQTEQSIKSCKSSDEEAKESLLYVYFKGICIFLEIPLKPNSLLNYVKKILDNTLKSIEISRDKMLKPHTGIADNSFTKFSNNDSEELYTLNMQAYHLEIFYQYYHIVSLLSCRKSSEVNININSTKVKGRDAKKSSTFFEERKTQLSVGKNDLLKSLYLLSSVEVEDRVNMDENSKILEESYNHIQKAIQVETKIRIDNGEKKEVTQAVPPQPVLVNRGSSWMVFKPAPFKPKCGKTIRWYCIFLRNALGNNVKVRLNDIKYEGTGSEVPYQSDCYFTVKGLEPNEKYMAAVAAYDQGGKLIGGSIGESSYPILAAHILPCLLVYAKLCRVAYSKNIWQVSKKVFNFIWDHFVERKDSEVSEIDTSADVYKLKDNKLKLKNVENCSIVTLHYFIESIFINNDIAVKEGYLFCDKLSDKGSLINGQISRLNQCENLLVAIEVCGWINDNMMCLQAVVLIYGLLVPIIYWKLPIVAAVKVLYHIHCVLQEIQTIFKNKKQNSTTESLRHMVCCLGYYVAKMLVHFKKKREAVDVLESTSKLIVQMNPPEGNKFFKTLIAIADDETVSLSGKKAKKQKPKLKNKAGGLKSLNEVLPGNMLEIRALEIYTLKLQREMMADCNNELTGNEDVVIMNAVVSTLPIPQAYKEVVKFKRKAQFFEAFVGILGRALLEGSCENVLEWVKETMSWLTKRNEIILNKVNTSDPKGIVVNVSNTESDKLKKYSNAVVEYGRASVASTVNPNRTENDRKKSEINTTGSLRGSVQGMNKVAGEASKHLLPIVEGSEAGYSNVSQKGKTDKKAMTIEEKKYKEAGLRIHGLLLDIWRIMQRRKKMRNVCFEELPWRCQMNLISAECHLQLALNAFKSISKQHGCPDLKNNESLMDINWFTLSTTGALIVSWIGCMKTCENYIVPVVDIGGTTVDHKPEVHIVPSVSKQTINVKVEKKASIAKASNQRSQEQRKEEAFRQFFHHLEQTFLHYQRAIVLSHRGKNWVLLQQTCNKLLSTTNNLMITIMLLNNSIDTTMYEIPYTLSKLRTIIYNPFFLASEYLLECMNDIVCNRLPDGHVEVYGNIHQNIGGSSLKFDVLDCNAYIDYGNIKRVIMFTIEVLFYQQKWERVICIIMKFNAISMGHFSESLLPLLVVSQKYLFDRLNENESAINCHPSIIFDPDTGVPLNINMVSKSMEPIEPGAHIDPVGHNLYEIPIAGSKYSVVPFEYNNAYSKLVQITNERPLYARMLEHSRRLCMAYLASQQGNIHIEGKFQRVDSAVSFVASQVKPPLTTPIEYKDETLETVEDIETHPLSKKLLTNVTQSYENTINLLKDAKQNDLLAQAMHELGNIKFHCKNIKSSFKWWSCAINAILGISSGFKNWRDLLVDVESYSLKSFKLILDKCGIWGCMLGGLIATKVARYIHYSHVDMQRNTCLLAAAFFKALFTSSLVHPSSYFSYLDYNIGINNTVTQIIPGLNLFTDDHRIHCNNLLDSTIWLSKHLVQFGYHLEVHPILTFAQYLSSNICQDVKSCVEILLLKIKSLCNLKKFEHAIKYFCQIFLGKNIPKTTDLSKFKVSAKLQKFNENIFLFDERNVLIINEFIQLTLKDAHYKAYGSSLCDKIMLMQVNILIEMANLINEIPYASEKPTVDKLPVKESAIPPNSSQGQMNVNESIDMMQKSSNQEDKRVDDKIKELSDYPARLKHKLLQCSELIINDISQKYDPDKGEDIEMYVNFNILLSKIYYNKCLTVSAIHHINLCLTALSSVNVSDNKLNGNDKKSVARVLPENVNVNVWLLCRQLVCFYLSMYDNDFQKIKSKEFFDEVGSIDENINNAIADCDMFNDETSKWIFEMMAIDVEVKHGKDITNILQNLQKLEERIIYLPEKSFVTKHLLIDLKKLVADLKTLHESNAEKSVEYYTEVENLFLKELCLQGYDIDTCKRYPLVDMLNTNNVLLADFICVKVCSYRAFAFAKIQSDYSVSCLKEVLDGIEKLFNLMERITTDLPLQRIELLLLKAEIQRHLVESGNCEVNVCVKTFLEVISHSKTYTCDFSTIRQCYLEISMILFFHLKQKEDEWTQIHASRLKAIEINNTPPTTPESPTKGRRRNSVLVSKQQPIVKPRRIVVPEKSSSKEINRLGKGIWICIRAASILAKAQQKLELLSGETSMASMAISKEEKDNMPSFAFEDNQGLSSIESINTDHVEGEINWSTLLDYVFYLRRCCSYASLVIGDSKVLIVRIPRHCRMQALKLTVMSKYFEKYSTSYQEDCLCNLPIDSILSIVKLSSSATRSDTSMLEEPKNVTNELAGSTSTPGDLPSHVEETLDGSGLKLFRSSLSIPSVKITNPLNPEKAKEFEIAVQLYLPELKENCPDEMNLMIAANNKVAVAKSPSHQFSQVTFVRHFSVNLEKVFALHEHMVQLIAEEEASFSLLGELQNALIFSPAATKSPARRTNKGPPSPNAASKTTSNIKTNLKRGSLKVEKGEEYQKRLEVIVSLLSDLLSKTTVEESPSDSAFEGNWNTIVSLANWFNPSFGHIMKTNETLFNWMMSVFGISDKSS